MTREKIVDQLAHYLFQGLGYQMTAESLDRSFLGIAWSTGLTKPAGGWRDISAYYHYEEAVAHIYLAMEAEILAGYISKIMESAESELDLQVRSSNLKPAEVLRGMVKWSYSHAAHRAHTGGATDTLSPQKVDTILAERSAKYGVLVEASVQDKEPVLVKPFQLGIARDRPWTAFPCYISDCICAVLKITPDGLEGKLLQIAVSQKRTAFYRSLTNKPS